ncbi:hypothetical protein A5780_10405 [Nocardia sp. 852002-20019_SCH5090214]|nr:hypothetical protein A5780_10405 [Nocardia sp. 852002-20019_SCH5090214]
MDNERRQARQIQATDYRPGRLAVRIVNRSGYSIYDVSLESVRLPSDPDATWKPGALESPEIVGRYQPVSVLIPNRQMVVDIELASGDGIVYDHMQEPLASGKLSYTIEFTDCDGRRWRRTDQQTPERIMT